MKKKNSPLPIVVIGISGRMGQELCRFAPDQGLHVVGGFDRVPAANGAKVCKRFSALQALKGQIVIDFSLPHLTDEVTEWCVKMRLPLVSGVTGLKPAQELRLKTAARKIPVFRSANMSVGVAVVQEMLKEFSAVQDYDFQIEELHHRHKKDRPSGTAKLLETSLETAIGRAPLPTLSMRGGGIFGIHRVLAMGPDEVICVEHSALNRSIFAQGALRAARWLSQQKPGLYGMTDLVRPALA